MLGKSADPMRGDILRALGFFHDAQAYQPLFDNLHSAQVTDRMNAILGLKNLGGKEVIPALLAALNDPEEQVRQVANFALEGLTGHKVAVSANPSGEEPARSRANGTHGGANAPATFSPPAPPLAMIGRDQSCQLSAFSDQLTHPRRGGIEIAHGASPGVRAGKKICEPRRVGIRGLPGSKDCSRRCSILGERYRISPPTGLTSARLACPPGWLAVGYFMPPLGGC